MAANQALIKKINALPSDRLGEVEEFVDLIQKREIDLKLVHESARSSEASFKAVWDNDADAAYDSI